MNYVAWQMGSLLDSVSALHAPTFLKKTKENYFVSIGAYAHLISQPSDRHRRAESAPRYRVGICPYAHKIHSHRQIEACSDGLEQEALQT
jgi:hypothetical protein